MKRIALATALVAAWITTTHAYDLLNEPDRYAQPCSVEEYRNNVPQEDDIYGICRSAGHVAECLDALHQQASQPDSN